MKKNVFDKVYIFLNNFSSPVVGGMGNIFMSASVTPELGGVV